MLDWLSCSYRKVLYSSLTLIRSFSSLPFCSFRCTRVFYAAYLKPCYCLNLSSSSYNPYNFCLISDRSFYFLSSSSLMKMLDSFAFIFLGLMANALNYLVAGSSKEANIFLTYELFTSIYYYYFFSTFLMTGYGILPYLDFGLWGFISLGMEGGSTIYLLLFYYRFFFFFYIYLCMSLELICMLFSLTLRLGDVMEGLFFY